MVFISGSKAPPFLKRYLTTKFEAEEYLRNLKGLRFTSLRPGFIYSKQERVWSVPLQIGIKTWRITYGTIYDMLPERTILK